MEKCSVQYLVISESMIKKKGANYYEHISEDGTSSRRATGGPSGGIPEDTVITGEDSSAHVGQFQYHAQGLEFLTRVPMGNNCITRIQSLRTVPLLLVSQSSFVSAVTCVRTLFHHPLR